MILFKLDKIFKNKANHVDSSLKQMWCNILKRKGGFAAVGFLRHKWKHSENNLWKYYKFLMYFNSPAKCYVISTVTRSTGSCFTCLEPRSNRSQHKTNGALVHSSSSLIQLLLYDVITSLANYKLWMSWSILINEASYFKAEKKSSYTFKVNDILLLFAILFLWLSLENHLHSQNAIIVLEYRMIIF